MFADWRSAGGYGGPDVVDDGFAKQAVSHLYPLVSHKRSYGVIEAAGGGEH